MLVYIHGAIAQPVTGLWVVTKVTAGDREMTPVAKWTRINEDGTYQAGNGWLQHSTGRWRYNSAKKQFVSSETIGIRDPHGPFSVTIANGKSQMTWKRREGKMEVTVSWKKIKKLPEAPADKITGL